MMERKTLLLLAILAGANAGPLNKVSLVEENRKCSSECPESSKFNYMPGTTYEFLYDSSFITALTGASEEVSGLHITATADIEVLDKCEFALKLRNVRLEEVDPANPERRLASLGSTEMRRLLETETLRFAFQDGNVAELCHTRSEDWRALNIKRGVLSAFQNSMDKLTENKTTTETDVAGNCEVNYNVLSNTWGQIKISKSKKILGCTDRHGKQTAFQAMPYRVPSTIQSMPLMKSSHNCDQSFHTDGRLIQSSCEEVHTFRPFSYGKSGATTTVKQTLKYNTYRSGVSTNQRNVEHRTDLRFEHAYEGERLERDYRDVINQLREICSVAEDDIRPEVPRMFANLVYKMRRLSTEALGNVWRMVDDNRRPFCAKSQVARKYFLDAIPSCGTIASVSLIQKMISRDDLPAPMAVQWLNSLAFVSRPSKQMLAEVKPLVTVAKPSRQAVLAVSAMVNSYCRVNAECNDDSEVMDIVKVFEDNLGYDCKNTNKDQREKVLMSLKALGNTGHAMKAVDTLGRCITNKKEATDIRVAAIQAFRRLQCPFDYSKMMSVFRDAEEDTEIRAHAYLAVMRCADKNIIDNVKAVLESEKSNQIATFVWTHLTNLMETSDPFKWTVREILEDEELSKEYNNDARKFSRNYEKSFFSQILNIGGKVESNVLFSTKSYMPRSATVNLTLDVFGESLNLLELEGRIEGFEYLVESFFGPNGYFQQNEMSNILNRKRRNIIKNADVQKVHTKFGAHMDDMTRGSASVKVFGNEIAFGEFAGFDPLNNKDTFNPLDILIKLASDQDIDYSKSAMFLDTSLIVPTMIGLPLNLTVNGTASINLKLGGHADVRKLMTSPHEFDIDGHIKPSGAVEVSSVMTVDAFVARSGIKMVTTVHSSTFMEGKLSMKNGEFTFNLNTPKDKMEVFDVQSKFFIIHKEEDREQKMITGTRVEKKRCTGSYLERALGIRLCGELQFPNALSKSGAPFFPLTGPSKVSVVLHKPDSMEGYNFQAKYKTEKVRRGGETHMKYMTSMGFNTPGSSIDRNIAVEYELNTADWSSKFELTSPWKKVNMNGAYTTRDDLKRATLTMTVDEAKEYYISAQLQTDQKSKLTTFTPNVEVRIPEREPITLSGSLQYQRNKKYSADLTLDKMFKRPVVFKVNLEPSISSSNTKLIGSAELNNQLFDSKVSGLFNFKPNKAMATRIQLDYNRDGKPKQTFVFSKKIRNLKTGSYSLNTLTTIDAYTDYNHQLAMELNYNKKHVDFEIDLNYGADFRDKSKNIFIKHSTDFGTKLPMKLESKSKLKFPGKDLLTNYDLSYNIKSLLDHEMTLTGRWNNKKLDSSFNLKDESTRRLKKYTANGNLEAGKLRLSFDEKFEQTAAKAFSHDVSVSYQGKNYGMETSYSQPEEKKHTFSTNLQIPNEDEISVSGSTTLDLKNFDASGSAKFRGKTYSTEAKLMKQPEGWSASSELQMPDKKYTADGLYTFNPRLVTATGNLNMHGDTYSAETRLVNKDTHKSVLLSANLMGKVYSAEGKMNKNSREVTGELNLVHPTRRIESDLNLSGNFPSAVRGQMSMSWDAGRDASKKMTITGSYNDNSDKSVYKHVANLRLNHPDHVGSFDLDFNSGDKSTVSAQWNQEKISGTGEFNFKQYTSGPFVKGEFGLTSTIKNIENLSLDFKHRARGTTYSSGGTFAWAKDKKIGGNLDVEYPSKSNIQSSLTVNTPFDDLNTLTFVWNHNLQGKTLEAHAQAKADARNFEITVSGTDKSSPRRPSIEGEVNLKTPFELVRDVTAKLTHMQDSRQINSNLDVTLAESQFVTLSIITDLHNNNVKDLTANFKLMAPGIEDISSSVNFQTSSQPMSIHADLAWHPQKKVALDGSLKTGDGFNGDLRLTTPFKKFERFMLTARHEDKGDNMFKSGATFQYAPGKKFDLSSELNFNSKYEVNLDFKIPCPEVKTIIFNLDHSGDIYAFTNKMEFESQPRLGKFTSDVSLTTGDDFEAKATITTPYEDYNEYSTSLTHKSRRDRMVTNANFNWPGRQEIKLNSDMTVKDMTDFNGAISLTTPFENLEATKFNFNHNGDLSGFTCHYDAEYMLGQKLSADITFNNDNEMSGSATIKTPFEDWEKTRLSFSHKGEMKDFQSSANIVYGGNKKIDTVVSFSGKDSRKLDASFSLDTPFEYFEDIELTYKHNGDWSRRFTCQYDIGYARGKKIQLSHTIDIRRDLSIDATFKSPFENFEDITASFKHSGKMDNFKTTAEVTYPEKVNAEITFSKLGDVEGSLKFTSPFENFENIEASFSHSGELKNFNSKAEVTYAPKTKIGGDVSFDMTKDIKASMTVKTPFEGIEQIVAGFSHNGRLNNFRTKGNVQYSRNRADFDVLFKHNKRVTTGEVTVRSPFENFRRQSASFKVKDRQLEADVVYNRNQKLDLKVEYPTWKDVTATLKTPYSDYEQVGAAYKFDKKDGHAEVTYQTGKKVEADVGYSYQYGSKNYKLDSSVVIKTPFRDYEEMGGKVTYNGYPLNFVAHADVYIPTYKYELDVENNLADELTKKTIVTVKTPHENFEELSYNMNLEGISKNFRKHTVINYYRGQSIVNDVTFKQEDESIEVTYAHTSPYWEDFTANFNYRGQPKDFTSHVDVTYAKDKTIEADLTFAMKNTISTTASLKTPFENFEDISINIVHKGYSWRSVSTSAVVKYSPRDTISASTTFSLAETRLLANIQFSSPYKYFEQLSAEVTHDGDLSAFKTNAELSYARGKKITASAVVKNRDARVASEGTFTLNTPFEKFENLQVILKNRLNGEEYQSSGVFTWAHGKSANIETTFQNSGEFFSRKDVKFYITATNTHRRDLSLSWKLDHSHMWKRSVNTRVRTSVKGIDYVDVTANYRNGRNEHRGSIEMSKPLPMKAEGSGSIDGGKVAGEIAFNWDTERRDSNVRLTLDTNNQGKVGQIKRDTMVKVITSRRTVIVEHKIVVSPELIQHNIVYCWDDARDKKVAHELSVVRTRYNLEVSNKLVSPWRSVKHTIQSTISRRGVKMESSFFWNADKDESKKVTLKGKHERFGNTMKQELVIQHPNLRPDITIQNEVNIGDANTIYSSNTEIDYSGDRRKKLTVSTNLRKEAVRFRGTNYTMLVEITHPASSLDISATTQLGSSDRFWTAGIGMGYTMSRSRQRKSFLLRTEINKLRNEVELQMLCPQFNLYNWAKMRDLSNKKYKNIHMEMRNTYNDKTVSSSFDIDQQKRLVDLKVNYDPENPVNQLHAYAKFNNDSAVTAEVYRIHNSNKVTEGLFTARLNNSRLMHSRIHWRPSALFDIKDGYYAIKEKVYSPEGTMFADAAEEASDRWRRSRYLLKTDMQKIVKQLDVDGELKDLDDDFNRFSGEMGHMIRRNEFYSGTIFNYVYMGYLGTMHATHVFLMDLDKFMGQMQQRIQEYVADLQVNWQKYQQDMAAKFENVLAQYEAMYTELKEQVTEAMGVLKEKTALMMEEAMLKASAALEPYVIKYMEYYNIASEKFGELMEKANAKYEEMMTKLRSTAYYQRVMAKVEQILEKYDAILNHDYAQYLPEMPEIDYSGYYNDAQDYVSQKAQQYTSAIYGAHDKLSGQIQDFLQRSEIQALKKYANIAVEHGKWAYQNYEIERHAKDIGMSLFKEAQDYAVDTARYVAKEYLRFDDTRFTVWNPKQGEIQLEVGLPVAWESFVTMPKYEKLVIELKKLQKTLRLPSVNTMYLDYNTIMDYFYLYKPTRDYMNWIPPFKAHATIAGQHIATFDHRHYEFKGTCSYILAHDFIDGNFTILVNYHAKKGKSLVILTNDKEVQLLPDFTVRLNGKKIDMPVQFGNTIIMRIGNAIRVHNTNGVTVTCDNVHDVCTVNMTGWYYGKTAGLFGTYDNEPSNDFTTLQNRQAEDTLEFTRSWSVRCRGHRNNANIDTPIRSGKTHATCSALFEEESSSLRSCFKVVDPSKYYNMCYNDLSSSKKNSDDETLACNVAANYIKECSIYDVNVRQPRHCVKCETGDKKKKFVIEGEDFTISKDAIKPPKSADVVLVVEEKSCNKKTIKRLQDIVKNIDASLKNQSMQNNRFGLVGFGGEGVHDFEQSHTMDGQLFNKLRLFKMGVNTLEISSSGSNDDVIRAIRMASMYPFRAGVAKVIVTLPCSACEEASVTYSEIQQLLIENLIQLHVIAEHDFTIKGKKSINNYGIDANKVYTNKDYKKFSGESSLRKHISVPKDLCVALAHETNGSVFNLKVITNLRSNILKKMISVFAKRVALTAKPAECQICQCVADDLGVGKSICRSCEMPSFTDYFSKIMRSKIEEIGDESKSKPRASSDAKLKKKSRKSRA